MRHHKNTSFQHTWVRPAYKIQSSQQCQTLFWHTRKIPDPGSVQLCLIVMVFTHTRGLPRGKLHASAAQLQVSQPPAEIHDALQLFGLRQRPAASSSGRSASSSALVQQIRKCRDSKLSVRYNQCGKVSFRSSNWSICTLRMNPAQCGWLRQTVLYYWPPNAQDLQSSSFSVIWVFWNTAFCI